MNDLFNYIEVVTGKKPEILSEEPLKIPKHLSMSYRMK